MTRGGELVDGSGDNLQPTTAELGREPMAGELVEELGETPEDGYTEQAPREGKAN